MSEALLVPGRCRICGCTEVSPCIDSGLPCCWVDANQTLCDSLECIARVPLRELEEMIPAVEPPKVPK